MAEIEPVEIDGATISRVTLHNARFIRDLDLRVNDFIFVERSGDVIPKVVGNATKPDEHVNPKWMPPTKCPVCGGNVKEDGARLYCDSDDCSDKQIARLLHYVSRDAMNMTGIGGGVLRKLYDEGWIRTPIDFYTLSQYKETLCKIEGFAQSKVDIILNAIEESRTQSLDRVLYALSAKHLGRTVSKEIVEHVSSLDEARKLTYKQLLSMPGIGAGIAASYVTFMRDNEYMLDQLEKELHPIIQRQTSSSDILDGKVFCVTGKLHGVSRDEAKSLIKQHGGRVASSLSKNVNYLLAGEKAGSKLEKAKKLGIVIITEDTFQSMVEV